MFRLVTIFALVNCAFAGTLPDDLTGRIVNGVDTTIQQHPYQVSIQMKKGGHFCGGTIINEDTIVTAAHCLQNIKPTELQVRLGSTEHNKGGEVVAVKALKNHAGYNSVTKTNDVAVIKLSTPVRQNQKIRFISLAERTPKTGTKAVVTGWGSRCFLTCISLPTVMQEVEVDIVDRRECASNKYKYGSQIKDKMVCAYAIKKDACQGDSGGPLVAEDRLVGIVSWGFGCAREGYPGVYTDVADFHKWIVDAAKSL